MRCSMMTAELEIIFENKSISNREKREQTNPQERIEIYKKHIEKLVNSALMINNNHVPHRLFRTLTLQ